MSDGDFAHSISMWEKDKFASLNDVHTLEDMQAFCDKYGLSLRYDIGHRGGYIGASDDDVARYILNDTDVAWMLPGKVGAYCNYLGGGMRGAICTSNWHADMTDDNEAKLQAWCDACERVYNSIESESGMQDTEDEDGETNWDNLATQKAREAGVRSAY